MTLSPLKRLYRLLAQYKLELRQIYAYAIFIGLVNLTLPLGIQAIINFLETGQPSSSWVVLVLFVLLGIAITGVLQIMQFRIVENIQQDLFARSAFEFAYRLPAIKAIELDRIHAPELVNRFFDTLTIQKGLPKILIDFSLAAFQVIFGLLLLAIYSPYFIILGVTLVLLLWLIGQFTGPKGLATSLEESKQKYSIAHWLEEIARVSQSFKLNPTSQFHLNKTDYIVSDYLTEREKHFGVLLVQFRMFIGFKVFVAAGLLVLGGILVFNNQLNLGQFVAAEIVIILVINSLEKVLQIIDTIYDVLTALEKIGYVTDLPLDRKNENVHRMSLGAGIDISAKKIQFKFDKNQNNVFTNLSFEIQKGSKVILSGGSGSGKSVLLKVLAGIYKVSGGDLLYNGLNHGGLDLTEFVSKMGMILPTNQLFDATYRENITLGRNVSQERIMEVLDLLNLNDHIGMLPLGINSRLDSGGRRLPRGVIQKLHIARAILKEPSLLLLEDPLHYLNADEREKMVDYFMDPNKPWTVVVVSDYKYWEEYSNLKIVLN